MIGWTLLGLFTFGALVVGYIAYIKIREGTQPGEPWVDRLLERIKADRNKQPSEPVPQRYSQGGPVPLAPDSGRGWVDPVKEATAANLRIQPPAAPPVLASINGGPMHPYSNAHQFDPPPNDVSPQGFGLFYPVGRDPVTGRNIIGGPPTYAYDLNKHAQSEQEAAAALARIPQRAEALDAWRREWQAQTFDGPIVANPLPPPGDLAYLASRVPEYHARTGRDLFRDVFAGTNPQIAEARGVGDAHVNQGAPYDQGLPYVVDTLIERYRRA